MRRQQLGVFGVVAAMAMCWLLIVPATFADTLIAKSGKVGVSSLTDNNPNYGTWCNYDNQGHMVGVTVRRPNVYARNTTAGVDSGKIGWQFIVKRKLDTKTNPVTFYRSPVWKATAHDDTPASLVDRT